MQLSSILNNKGTQVVTIRPGAMALGLASVLAENNIGAAVVSEDGTRILGIASERDVVRAIADRLDLAQTPVADVMSDEVCALLASDSVEHAMEVMTNQRVRHLPIVDESLALIGIVSIGDLVKLRLDQLETERSALMEYITKGG
ncbi:MAG: CBS domain-containing protein [Actinomycetota bacterium]|nr:CBS domain-containing protein [Actinomycetota bacterium]MDP2288243.1 CBS domain-containing protein [Actinomycetota bacterium]